MFAALAYNTVGDTSKAMEHAEKALEAGLVNNGHGSGEEGDESEMRGCWGGRKDIGEEEMRIDLGWRYTDWELEDL
jgi:hypothetical protein